MYFVPLCEARLGESRLTLRSTPPDRGSGLSLSSLTCSLVTGTGLSLLVLSLHAACGHRTGPSQLLNILGSTFHLVSFDIWFVDGESAFVDFHSFILQREREGGWEGEEKRER